MTDLKQARCEACRKDSKPLAPEECTDLLAQVPDWEVVEYGGERQLERIFKFKNFAEALAFTNRVGELAEAENHHPAILLEYGKVRVNWWTHVIGGLHRNDFIMAARTDEVRS